MKSFLKLNAFILIVYSGSTTAQAQNYCEDYESYNSINTVSVFDYFGNSIAIIQPEDRSEKGTGYLIDDRGYFITAYHTIKNSINASQKVVGNIPRLGELSPEFEFEIIAYNSEKYIDVALLKIVEDSSWIDVKEFIRPIDFDFGVILLDEKPISLGYPEEEYENLKRFEGPVVDRDKDGTIQIEHTTYPGHSGGPLINKYGKVDGTLIRYRLGNHFGFYLPSTSHKEILSKVPPSTKLIGIHDKLLSGSISEIELSQYLKEGSGNELTNLELFAWSLMLRDEMQNKLDINNSISCKLLNAIIQRIKDPFIVSNFFSSINYESIGRKAYNIGAKAYRNNEFELARNAFAFSENLLNRKLNSFISENQQNLDFDEIVKQSNGVSIDEELLFGVDKDFKKIYVANLIKDYSESKFYRTKLDIEYPKFNYDSLSLENDLYDLISTMVATVDYLGVDHNKVKASYFSFMGDLSYQIDNPELAMKFYASAWKLGLEEKYILDNYIYTSNLSRMGKFQVFDPSTGILEITTNTVIDVAEVDKLLKKKEG